MNAFEKDIGISLKARVGLDWQLEIQIWLSQNIALVVFWSIKLVMLAGGQGGRMLQDDQPREAGREDIAAGILADERHDDWGSLRADLDRALSKAQQEAVPQPPRSNGSQPPHEADGGEAAIPQIDGAGDRLPWQEEFWTLSPHIFGQEHSEQLKLSPTHGSDVACLDLATEEAAEISRSYQGPNPELQPSGQRQSAEIVFTPRESPAATASCRTVPKASGCTASMPREADSAPARNGKSYRPPEKRAYSPKRPRRIPQLDGSGDRPRRLGSSWNRGKGRLLRQPSPVRDDRSPPLENPQPQGAQGSQKAGSQKGSSQRYAALSVQESPEKSGQQSHALNTGKSSVISLTFRL